MRKRSLERREPVFASQSGEPTTVRENSKAKSERAIDLHTSPVTIKSSWSITFNEDMGKIRSQANRSSTSAMRRPTTFVEARNSFIGPGGASRYEHLDDWTVEESLEQESEDETVEDRRMFTRSRKMERRIDDPNKRGAKGSWDRTLLDILRESSESAWKSKSAFTDAARKFPLRNDRQQELSARQAVQQCLERVLKDQKIKNEHMHFKDELNLAMFHNIVTIVQAEHLQKITDRRARDRG